VFTKDKLDDWLEMYVKVMELTYWTSSPCRKASYDEARKEWTVLVDRQGELLTLTPKQLVRAPARGKIANKIRHISDLAVPQRIAPRNASGT
jgi:putative flavoprotein involved in K+ transport